MREEKPSKCLEVLHAEQFCHLYNSQGFVKFGEFSKGNFFTRFLPQKLHFPCIFLPKSNWYHQIHTHLSRTVYASTTKYTYSFFAFYYTNDVILYTLRFVACFCPHNRSWSSFHNSTCRSDSFFHVVFVCLWVYCMTLFGCGLIYWTSKIDFNLLF